MYLGALVQGWGAKDDSAMVRQYFSQPIGQVAATAADAQAAQELVLDLMRVVNLVAAAEAIAFARYLKVDLKQFHGLVAEAAGASRVFITQGLEMIEGRVGANAETVDAAVARLEKVVQKARDLHCPLHLGNAALSVLLLARRAGLGGEGSTSVIKVWQ